MNLISTKTHGILDYVVGALLFASPWMLHFNNGKTEMIIPIVLGLLMTIGSLFTRYEVGLIPVIPMRAHLTVDIVAGIFLAASPWIFDFHETVFLPHVIFGVTEVLVSLLTSGTPGRSRMDVNPDRVIP